jgi:undecaprenyl-diphosphatase
MNYWSQSQLLFLFVVVFLLKVDQWFNHSEDTKITYLTAFKIGLYQCLAMVPGFSKWRQHCVECLKTNSYTSVEFSFFLAVLTMFGATEKKNVTIITKMVL